MAVTPFAERVTAASEGTIEVKLFPGMGLAQPQNVLDRVQNGVAEMGYMLVGFYPTVPPQHGRHAALRVAHPAGSGARQLAAL